MTTFGCIPPAMTGSRNNSARTSPAALDARNLELTEPLDQVRTLRGLVSICAACKKIRDDEGYWHQVEIYVYDHTEAEFSHGLCPDRMPAYFPNQPA